MIFIAIAIAVTEKLKWLNIEDGVHDQLSLGNYLHGRPSHQRGS